MPFEVKKNANSMQVEKYLGFPIHTDTAKKLNITPIRIREIIILKHFVFT